MRDNDHTAVDVADVAPGFTAIGIFLFLGAVMANLAAITLLWRGTVLDRVWVLNPIAYKQLIPLGAAVGIFFLLLGAALTAAGIGLVSTSPLGMETGGCNYHDTGPRGRGELRQRGLASRWSGSSHRGCTLAVSLAAENQSHVCLESLSKKFKKAIASERRDCGNLEIGSRENVFDGPRDTLLLPHA